MKTIKKASLLFASLALVLGAGLVGNSDTKAVKAEEVTDTLTATTLIGTSTTYTSFKDVKVSSEALYAGIVTKSSSNIQSNNKNNYGIVTTKSGGTIKSVKINVSSGTNKINVYASNTAYTASSDLYSKGTAGTLIDSTTSTKEIVFPSDTSYEYFGIRQRCNLYKFYRGCVGE